MALDNAASEPAVPVSSPVRIDAARFRRRLIPFAAGVLVAALLVRVLAAILPMEVAAGFGAIVALGLPGWAAVRLSGLDRRLGTAEAVAIVPVTGLAVWAVPLAVGFLVGLPFTAVLAIVLVLAAAGLAASDPFDWSQAHPVECVSLAVAALAAAGVGWYYQGGIGGGDALFHAGRVRKLIGLDRLSLSGVSTYLHGPPHAGYAFPLLHAAQAGAVKLAGGDPSATYISLVPIFVCLVPLAVYGAGRAIGGPAVGAAAALLASWDALVPGAWPLSVQWTEQPPTFTFIVLLPIGLLAAYELRRTPSNRSLQALSVATAVVVAFVHPTYVVPLLAITTGLALLAWNGFRVLLVSYVAAGAVLLWIYWEALAGAPATARFNPPYRSGVTRLYGHNAMLSGSAIMNHRGGFVIAMVGMLALLVLWHRRYALAAAVMVGPFVLVALPGALALVIPVVNLAQARRLWIAIPWPYLAAMVIALLAARFRGWRLALTVVALFVVAWLLRSPQSLAWWRHATYLTSATALAAMGIALWQIVMRRRARPGPPVAAGVIPTLILTATVLALPFFGHDFARKHPSGRGNTPTGAIDYLRSHGSTPFPVVLSSLRASYVIAGLSTVYVVAVDEGHMRAEPKIDPLKRRDDVIRFLTPGTSESARDAIMKDYDVRYVVIGKDSPVVADLRADTSLREVYARGASATGNKSVVFERR